MAIKYLGAKRIQGLSTDSKPTDVPINTIFEQTNGVPAYYWYQTLDGVTGWYPTLQDSFLTDEGTEVGGEVTHNSTDKVIDILFDGTNSTDRWYLDLGSVSDTKWTVQFSLKKNSHSGARPFHIHMSDLTVGDWTDEAQDGIGIYIDMNDGDGQFALARSDNGNRLTTGSTSINSGTFASNGTTRYFTLKRLSSTSIGLYIYSDSARTSLVGSDNYTISGTTGLRYFLVSKESHDRGSVSVDLELDDFQFFDGVSV